VPRVRELHLACDHFDFEIEVLVRHAWAGWPTARAGERRVPPAEERVSHFDKRRDNSPVAPAAGLVARRLGALAAAPFRVRPPATT
jgi:hypothetical protein